ncbi:MAG: M28 family peptidase [Deltaproteobacteria bacterium]|nr:M28 family peptidase [Deltaproteobacteria bacterium]
MLRRWLALVLACCGGCNDSGRAAAPTAVTSPRVADAAEPVAVAGATSPSVESIRADTRELASDAMDGRRPGTEGGARAVAYIIERMTALGLAPGARDGGWTQRVPMRVVSVDASRSRLGFGRGDDVRPLVFGDDVVGTSLRPAGTLRFDAPLVFVGHGITAPEYDWDDYAGVEVDGAVVVVLVGDPPLADGRFAGDALTYYGRWSYKFERALAAGARGVLIVHDTEAASYGWSVVRNSWSRERFAIDDEVREPSPALAFEGWITHETADGLATRDGSSLAAWKADAIATGFRGHRLRDAFVGEIVTSDRTLADVNVVGALPGTRADEAVVITAHWDHLGHDATAAADADAIFNGAIDNASGVAGMLAIAGTLRARVVSGRPLGRTVLFVATTGEEEGLLGSTYFAAHPPVPPTSLVAAVNLDSMNVDGRTRSVQVIGPGQSTLEDLLAEVTAAEGRTVVPDEHPESGGYFRSDHFALARVGVPAIYLRGGSDMEAGGRAQGQALGEVRAQHYHSVDDEFDPAWSFAGTLQDALTVASLVARVADDAARPQWKPGASVPGVIAPR